LAHAANLPNPADLLRKIEASGALSSPAPSGGQGPSGGGGARASVRGNLALASEQAAPQRVQPSTEEEAVRASLPQSFRDLVALFEEKREMALRNHLYHHVRLVHYQPGRIEVRVADKLPTDFAGAVTRTLQQWTGVRWMLSLSQQEGEEPLSVQDASVKKARWQNAEEHPLVKAALARFAGAKLLDVRQKPALAAEETSEAQETFENESEQED
jgi:DNA polymerase-3 subunit gamma/tau